MQGLMLFGDSSDSKMEESLSIPGAQDLSGLIVEATHLIGENYNNLHARFVRAFAYYVQNRYPEALADLTNCLCSLPITPGHFSYAR